MSASNGGTCATAGSQLEFPPVHDLHLGIVTSALGSRLGNLCDPAAMAGASGDPFSMVSAHNDDQGHLIARSLTYNAQGTDATEGSVTKAVVAGYTPAPSGFLYYFPTGTPANSPVTPETTAGAAGQAGTLIGDFGAMVGGVGIWGCGIESQLESWYRFLVQPDPYASSAEREYAGRHVERGRHDRSSSSATTSSAPTRSSRVIVLSDENDSEIDVRSLDGQGFNFMATELRAAAGHVEVRDQPGHPGLRSCSVNASDSACTGGLRWSASTRRTARPNDWGYDLEPSPRAHEGEVRRRPAVPDRAVRDRPTSPLVPDRYGEYQDSSGNPTSNYLGTNDCTNPLYAASASGRNGPRLGRRPLHPRGRRADRRTSSSSRIIGGVPHQLLHFDPNSASNSVLTDDDWVRILGNNPVRLRLHGHRPAHDRGLPRPDDGELLVPDRLEPHEQRWLRRRLPRPRTTRSTAANGSPTRR